MEENANTQNTTEEQVLTGLQLLGMQQYQLTLEDVQTTNFSEATLNGINTLLMQSRANTIEEAFEELRELNETQIQGVTQYQMSREQVLDPQFSFYTLEGINNLVDQNRADNLAQGAQMLTGLNPHQIEGVVNFNFTRQQVRVENYGMHTNDAINRLAGRRRRPDFQQALNRVSGLDPVQTRGMVEFNLTRENVTTQNFGRHTLEGMQELRDNREAINNREAFEALQGLDTHQVSGITFYGLRRADVTIPEFGQHTNQAIMRLRLRTEGLLTFQEAHQMVHLLNRTQAEGVSQFGLTRDQVESPQFTEPILDTMRALSTLNPEAEGEDLLNYALQLPEYQVRAISAFDFTPEQLGIAVADNAFIQLDNETQQILSASTIEAMAELMQQNNTREEALEAALTLDINQKVGIVDLGLTLDQVRDPIFNTDEDLMNSLMSELWEGDSDNEIDLPLSAANREKVKAVMDAKIALSMVESLEAEISVAETNSVAPGDELSVADGVSEESNTDIVRTAYPMDEEDVEEFLAYAIQTDIFGIFEGISRIIEAEENLETQQENKENQYINPQLPEPENVPAFASAQPVEESNEQIESDFRLAQALSLSAFMVPNVPPAALRSQRSDSEESSEGRKPAAKPNKNQDRKSPKSRRKGF